MTTKKLSPRQDAILEFIEEFFDDNGYPPTIREIGKACDISSTSVVNYNLNKLERESYLVRDREVSRGLRLANQQLDRNIVRIPKAGRIVASEPLLNIGDVAPDDHIELTRDIVNPNHTLFALEVSGDSMVDAMINDGDTVIMRPDQPVNNGDLVAVWIEDREEMTLKHIYYEKDRVRLQPANPTMKPIYINKPETVQVQGHVVAVVRQI